MDDMISRKAAVSRISDLLILELKGKRIPTWNEVYNAIGDIPAVPAAPLDKLCEWLAEKAVFFAGDNDSDPEAWKEMIKECVLEEHNATDNP